MVKYENGKIYRLVNDELGLTYYGSTCNELRKRFNEHKTKKNRCTSRTLFESGECKIYLIEKFPCNDKMELKQRERYYIENNECVNKAIPCRTKKEHYNDNKQLYKQWHKQYHQDNKEKITQYIKQYHQDNKESIKEYKKQYNQDNKEIISEKKKIKYQVNKDIIKEKAKIKITCDCGSVIRKGNIVKHKKTIKHQTLLNNK